MRRKGFSLTELLVAVTIVGIAAGMSIPRIGKAINQTKIQRAAQALSVEVRQAFAISGRNRKPVKIRWNSSSLQLQVTDLTGTVTYRKAGLGNGSGYGLASSEVSVTPTTLIVFPNGLAADTLLIALTRQGYSRKIRVSRAGMVRLQ